MLLKPTIPKKDLNNLSDKWYPSQEEYDPNLTTEDWIALLNDTSIFSTNALTALKRLLHYGGAATCTQLANEYGGSFNFYNKNLSLAAEYVAEKKGLPKPFETLENSKNARWWPILFVGKNTDKSTPGVWIWKLRPELAAALEQIDLSQYPLYDNKELPTIWKISHGDGFFYPDERDELAELQLIVVASNTGALGRTKATQGDDFMHTMKAGDYFYLCYSSRIQLLGQLTSDDVEPDVEKEGSWYQRPYQIIAKSIDTTAYTNTTKRWTPNFTSTCVPVPQGELQQFEKLILQPYFNLTLGDLLPDAVQPDMEPEANSIPESPTPYTREDFLNEVYISEPDLDTLLHLLKRKKNIILQGAPGVGKTFAAEKLAYAMMKEKDKERIKFIQFHQNYSYEDFIMGYKPTEDGGFKLENGVFYNFCKKAAADKDRPYFFIIDEINRGNLSKIFGELLMLIEADKRSEKWSVELAYNHESFSVPDNLYIIGMMNTADRSLAMMDYALRRRFSFFDMKPAFNNDKFQTYLQGFDNNTFTKLIQEIKNLNKDIAKDPALGEGFCIGHSYFCNPPQEGDIKDWLEEIVRYEIIPTLKEYWFDDKDSLDKWTAQLERSCSE